MKLDLEIVVTDKIVFLNPKFGGSSPMLSIEQANEWVTQLNCAISKAKSIKDMLGLK
jgi:hypothetical protein